jgi:hypothetical protein
MLTDSDLQAIWLTARLAAITTLILLLIGTPIAWWLARTRTWWKGPIGAVVALPLVLPPSVLGFYLLLAMGPHGPVGQLTSRSASAPCPLPSGAWSSPRCFIRCLSWCNRCKTPSKTSANGRSKSPPPCALRRSTPSFQWYCRWPSRASSPPAS